MPPTIPGDRPAAPLECGTDDRAHLVTGGADGGPHLRAMAKLERIIAGRCRYFVRLATNERLKQLPMVLASCTPGYRFWAGAAEDGEVKGFIPLQAFDVDDAVEWPDFQW